MSNDSARQQARDDIAMGRAPANTHGWPAGQADAYQAEVKRQQEINNNKK